ncbi:MAG TPA: hypothetical protein VFJ12_05475 [Segeticoccus sp.]|nr:hypothetical protein [Segeticoccus sp.]
MVAVGPQGPPGADGAAATDADVAGYLGDPASQTRVAGDALYASQAQGAAADAAQPAATLDADTAANVADPATQTGQALAAAIEAGALTLVGHGFPAGQAGIDPPPDAKPYRYIDLDETNGAREWAYRDGSWAVIDGDTGSRAVESVATHITGFITIRRVNCEVHLEFGDNDLTSDAGPFDSPEVLSYLPAGWRPTLGQYLYVTCTGSIPNRLMTMLPTGRLGIYGTDANQFQFRYNGAWLTDDPWPTVLP